MHLLVVCPLRTITSASSASRKHPRAGVEGWQCARQGGTRGRPHSALRRQGNCLPRKITSSAWGRLWTLSRQGTSLGKRSQAFPPRLLLHNGNGTVTGLCSVGFATRAIGLLLVWIRWVPWLSAREAVRCQLSTGVVGRQFLDSSVAPMEGPKGPRVSVSGRHSESLPPPPPPPFSTLLCPPHSRIHPAMGSMGSTVLSSRAASLGRGPKVPSPPSDSMRPARCGLRAVEIISPGHPVSHTVSQVSRIWMPWDRLWNLYISRWHHGEDGNQLLTRPGTCSAFLPQISHPRHASIS
ncbi:hypothetical protein B0T25DRAFT_175242 [Lasiosphaeria hispida]|uniref:Uncharacterized protein n=1 Tax=Lasiosphaeria hispida TaxID=260671 RepID=A0AAJ0MGN3_9PEZI|nr:hypothetical protein B0T25DRAFT_175242 [Lasiosphaeria hispida]